MTTNDITSFFRTRGMRVVETASCAWYNDYQQDRVYQSFPPHRLVTPSRVELQEVFAKAPGALALRFAGPSEATGSNSFVWVRRAPYDIDRLSANMRSRIRRGLKRCDIRPVRFEEILAKGWEAHCDTAKRHGESVPQSLGLDEKLDDCPAYEAWGAFVGDRLAAYLVTLHVEDWAHILVNRSVTAYHKLYCNNALVFSVVKELLARPSVAAVGYGGEGLVPSELLDRFKTSIGFSKEPVRQRIVLAPRVRPLINPLTSLPITALAGVMRNNGRLQKIAGFCRIASHG